MTAMDKKVKKLTIINIIMLVAIALFCFQNSDLNIEGLCEECCVFTPVAFFVGKIVILIQILIALVMCCMGRKLPENEEFVLFGVLAVVSILLAGFQCILFFIPMDLKGHGDYTREAQAIVNMIHIQFLVMKILCAGLIISNIKLIRAVSRGMVREEENITNQVKKNQYFFGLTALGVSTTLTGINVLFINSTINRIFFGVNLVVLIIVIICFLIEMKLQEREGQ